MTDHTHDIIVIGGGTAGLVTAAGAAALGAKAALVERAALGGDCLWTGCVPSKALIAFARKRQLSGVGTWADAVAWLRSARDRIAMHDDPQRFRGLGVDVILSPARVAGPERVEVDGRQLRAKRIVLALGSAPVPPAIPGLADTGFLTNVTAFDQPTLPDRLIVLGGGAIGLELAQTYRRLGAAVSVLELLPEVLPKEDPEVGRFVRERLAEEGIAIHTGFHATAVAREGATKVVRGGDGARVVADEILVATGRRPNTREAEPERAGVELDHGAVRVNARLETTARGVWAAGDVTGGLQFTHVADYMAKVVVRNALTPLKTTADYRVVPWVTFTDPEVARVGLTAAEAEARGERIETFRYGFSELDRAIVDGAAVGFSKIVTRPNGRILGATLVGRGAGELIMELVLAMRYGITLPALARTMHPYPTMSEIVKRTADTWYRTKYTDTRAARLVQRIVRWWL
ncbi:MAG TPA: FAD-dependent oxidoreductase [Gemmatimonadales bacterium]|nr:FAD-dependent oxidoreductase [Gemmatimonadales bacterium]